MVAGKMAGVRVVLVAALLCAAAAMAAAQQGSGVRATWANYRTEETGWNLTANNVFCARRDADKPLTWRSKYEWTAFCGPNGPVGEAACGKCIKVTNTATGKAVTVRVVDECGDPAFDLDYKAFNEIDTDGQGSKNGHLTVDYAFVDCDNDDDEPAASGVHATWTNYRTEETNWDLNANNVFCASQDADKPLTWRSKYGWTAFCGPKGPVGKDACGRCINVTNPATNSTVTVRVVDECGDPAFDLDYETAFKKIDTDGQGSKNGHLTVDYVFVDCGDDSETGDSIIASM